MEEESEFQIFFTSRSKLIPSREEGEFPTLWNYILIYPNLFHQGRKDGFGILLAIGLNQLQLGRTWGFLVFVMT